MKALQSAASVQQRRSKRTSLLDAAVSTYRSRARAAVGSKYFEGFFASLIIANSLFIGIQLEITSQLKKNEEEPTIFFWMQNTFALLFSVEVIARFGAEGSEFSHSMWNWLDVIVLIASSVEIFLHISKAKDQGFETVGNIRIVRVLRITRLARIVRILKIVRFLYALRSLVMSILSTLKALFWAMLLLLMIIYLYGMIFAQLAGERLKGDEGDLSSGTIEKLDKYWGSLTKSAFTLFKSVTGGVSWEEVTYSINEVHWSCVVLFLSFFIFTYFAVLNVVTAVFCQSAIESANRDYDLVVQAHIADKEVYARKLRQLFSDLDEDGSGGVNMSEFQDHLNDEKVQAYLTSLELNSSDVWRLFRLLDNDESQVIDLEEFLTGCFRLRGPAKAVEMAEMMYEMRHIRKVLYGFISATVEALARMMEQSGLDADCLMLNEEMRSARHLTAQEIATESVQTGQSRRTGPTPVVASSE